MEKFKLNNGNLLPKICYGPGIINRGIRFKGGWHKPFEYFKRKDLESKYVKSIRKALENGVTFIDYSAAYGREDLISKAIKEAQIPRENLILTTRVTNSSQQSNNVREVVYDSLKRYSVNQIDLLMFHWPVTDYYLKTWKELIKLQEEGICKNIGVANCHEHHIEILINETGVIPSVNQVEIHPLFTQKPLISYCQSLGIQMEAYTPLARMDERILRLPKMKALSKKYNKSISQIILRWHIQNGVIPVFRSMNSERQKENLNIFDFEIVAEDMSFIDSININSRLRYDPDNCDFSIL